MTKRPISWTDEELWAASDKSRIAASCFSSGGADGHGAAQPGSQVWMQRFVVHLDAIHPAECREREREAWDRCADFGKSTIPHAGREGIWHKAERDRLYPSLLLKSPPPLVLSSGRWVRATIRGFLLRPEGDNSPLAQHGNTMPILRTASDARAFAEWLEKYGSDDERK